MKVAIVILNWNGKALLEQFLPSVLSYSKNADIYVADNASNDTSVEFVKSTFPSVKIIQNSDNGGYAKGYNDALKFVDADVFCLLNSDVEVTPNWLDPVIKEFNTNPSTSIIQPKILDYKNKSYFEYAGAAGGFIDKFGYPYCRGRIFNTIEKDEGQYDDNSEIFWASGACMFIKKEVFDSLNGFDESFFAHMEEIDLCWRAFNLGYSSKYVHDSVVYHVGGATLQESNPQKTYLNFRNSLFMLVKNAPGHVLILVIARLLLDGLGGIKFLFELKPKHNASILKAHLYFYGYLPKLIKQRKQLKKRANYFKTTSIVWQYYFKGNKHFNCL
ncbi:dTDP-Rha--alpha-D-GlcNAc-pyrophosphate polyprenol alpha-3-L-rhamnosyltransferase [Hanstruepera neustonica]|uniref:dTDP-Rha--alpha-D-GlcNAc-pyrophosphate polyprenol alpha-3-L-rhamnosyltransferase n=1 Tax=Hanstruepera neustonica TaxID=1445657 RepID=A0A2K1DX70_9FLAO|nr:glycosyltransferase family 2 protein [Hanstruepera neustonica]PNQ72622.1 dTDP-Rha--alpha-D-GlcNAc-pyrophosphate polyprenol alpha-3-L-rhamnosyltransferase [Hanstruepera neustonica]